MPATLWDDTDRRALLRRLERLRPDAAPRWGRMDASRMVVHVTDALRMATGELQCTAVKRSVDAADRQAGRDVLPALAKGVPTAPELLARRPEQWTNEVAALRAAIEEFSIKPPAGAWPNHPRFGHLTGIEWGRFMYRHLDHHLTQFGL